MKKILSFVFFTFFIYLQAWGVKATPYPITYNQPDGTTVTVRIHGDEHFHYSTTLDGMLVVNTGKGVYVAKINDNNELVATNVLAHNADMRSDNEIELAKQQDLNKYINTAKAATARAKALVVEQDLKVFPHLGNPHVLVLLADFKDCKFTVADPVKNFDQYLNASGHGEGALKPFKNDEGISHDEDMNYGSVAEYFYCSSMGKFRPVFDVADGIVHLSQEVSYYGGDNSGNNGDRMDRFIPEVINYANNNFNIDFSKYDSNDDGYCDLVYVIFAGQGENTGGASSTIWAKSSSTNIGTFNGKRIGRYGVSCELASNVQSISGIGVLCHELSHTMGMPDFYYTYTNDAISDQGMEYWSVMDWGMYLPGWKKNAGAGTCPRSYTAWERSDMDWFEITPITSDGHYTLYPLNRSNGNAFKVVNPNNSSEYFILENSQQEEWCTALFGHGLQITHVNYNRSDFSLGANNVNNIFKHPRMVVVPADGRINSSYNDVSFTQMKESAKGDLFPGARNTTDVSREHGLPNFDWFTSKPGQYISTATPTYPNYLKIYNITETEDGKVEFDIILDTTTGMNSITADDNKAKGNKTYNLQGQEVDDSYHGIVIKNGKKFRK